jgi:hypothetical protein
MVEYILLAVCMLLGVFTHVIKKIVELRKTNDSFSLKTWLTKYPYKTILTVMAGVGGFFGLMAAGELTYASSFMAGFMANSLGGAAEK